MIYISNGSILLTKETNFLPKSMLLKPKKRRGNESKNKLKWIPKKGDKRKGIF